MWHTYNSSWVFFCTSHRTCLIDGDRHRCHCVCSRDIIDAGARKIFSTNMIIRLNLKSLCIISLWFDWLWDFALFCFVFLIELAQLFNYHNLLWLFFLNFFLYLRTDICCVLNGYCVGGLEQPFVRRTAVNATSACSVRAHSTKNTVQILALTHRCVIPGFQRSATIGK